MAQYTIKSRVVGDIIYIDTLDENGNSVPDSMRFFEVTATTPEELQNEIERATETVRNELGKADELTPSSVVQKQEEVGNQTEVNDLTPAKTAEVAATSNDSEVENAEQYVTSGSGSTEAGVNQINEELKTKPEPPKVTVNVNVPEQEKPVERIIENNNTTEIRTGEKTESTPSSIISDQAQTRKEDKQQEPVLVKNQQTVPTDTTKEKEKEEPSKPPVTSLTMEQAIIRYNIEHGLNPDGSAKTDKTNPANSSPGASAMAAAGEKEVPQENNIKVIQSSDDRFKLTNYQQTQGTAFIEKKLQEQNTDPTQKASPTSDKSGSVSYVTTPGSVVKTAAEPPAKTAEQLRKEDDAALILQLNKLREVGWLDKIEPTKPSETGTEVEKKENKKEQEISGEVEGAKTLGSSPITTDLTKNPVQNKTDDKTAGIPRDPSLNKKDLLSKVIEEGLKKRQEMEATVKTSSNVPPTASNEKPEVSSDLPEVKVKTAEKKVTPEIAKGIMQNSPESRGLTTVNENLAKMQSQLLTIGQTQINNANTSSTITNSNNTVRNEDNRKITQEERRAEKEMEKTKEKEVRENSNQLTEFYLHGIYDALVSQGIKIKSY